MATAEERSVEGIRDVFRCFICMEKLEDARLCPHCSKLCCFQCICRWLTEQRPQCPHCRTHLRVTELVKCRWAEEVTQKLDTLNPSTPPTARTSTSDTEKCNIHQEKLSVFCWDCQACICHHCALWGGQHSGHTLKPLEDEYNVRVDRIGTEVKKLRRRLCRLIQNLQELEENIEDIRKGKDERVREIRLSVDLMISRLELHMKDKLVSLTGQKRSLSMEVEMVEGILTEVEDQLSSANHPSLVNGSEEIFKMLAQIQRSTLAPISQVPADFVSEVVPPYESQTFVLTGFSQKRNLAEPIHSDPLIVNGLTWRLKVYPDGNGAVRGSYISVFLELTDGPPEQSRYEYRVEMMHQRPGMTSTQNIVREFASEFEIGECWGYNRFFKVDSLATDGFLDPESDTLVLKFHVRPPTFYQKCKDLTWYINELRKENSEQYSTQAVASERDPSDDQGKEETEPVQGDSDGDSETGDIAEGINLLPFQNDYAASENGEEDATKSDMNTGPNSGAGSTSAVIEKDIEEEVENRETHTDNDVDDELAATGRGRGSRAGVWIDWPSGHPPEAMPSVQPLLSTNPCVSPSNSVVGVVEPWSHVPCRNYRGSGASGGTSGGNYLGRGCRSRGNDMNENTIDIGMVLDDSITQRLSEQLSRWVLSSEDELSPRTPPARNASADESLGGGLTTFRRNDSDLGARNRRSTQRHSHIDRSELERNGSIVDSIKSSLPNHLLQNQSQPPISGIEWSCLDSVRGHTRPGHPHVHTGGASGTSPASGVIAAGRHADVRIRGRPSLRARSARQGRCHGEHLPLGARARTAATDDGPIGVGSQDLDEPPMVWRAPGIERELREVLESRGDRANRRSADDLDLEALGAVIVAEAERDRRRSSMGSRSSSMDVLCGD